MHREHLGINVHDDIQPDIMDPVITSFYKSVWMKQASINTVIYDKVFKCVPSDDVTSFQELKVCHTNTNERNNGFDNDEVEVCFVTLFRCLCSTYSTCLSFHNKLFK